MSNKAAAILAGTAVLVGVLIGRASADTGGTPRPAAEVEQAKGGGPDPKAYPRTMKGAATAAAAYSDAFLRAALVSAEERRALINAISSDTMRDQIGREGDEAAQAAGKLFDLPKEQANVLGRITPLGYRVVSFTNDSARVEIWTLMLLGKPDVGHGIPPQFRTASVDLAWERSAWRLAGTPQGKDGPTPVADNPQVGGELVAAVKDLQEFSHAAR